MFSFLKRQIVGEDEAVAAMSSANTAGRAPSQGATAASAGTATNKSTTAATAAGAASPTPSRNGAAMPAQPQTTTAPSARVPPAGEPEAVVAVSIPFYRVKNSYVEYVVDVTGVRRTWRVYRRYQQFKALDQALKQLSSRGSPNHGDYGALPVLPRSHWMEVTNQSAELVDRRRRYLEAYLQQLLVPRNGYYAAHTALYPFLHEGEVPIDTRQRVLFPALLGLSTVDAKAMSDGAHHNHVPTKDVHDENDGASHTGAAATVNVAGDADAGHDEQSSSDSDMEGLPSHSLHQNAAVRASAKHLYATEEEAAGSPLSAPNQPFTVSSRRDRAQESLDHSYLEGDNSSDGGNDDDDDDDDENDDSTTAANGHIASASPPPPDKDTTLVLEDKEGSSTETASDDDNREGPAHNNSDNNNKGSPFKRGDRQPQKGMRRMGAPDMTASESCSRLYDLLHASSPHKAHRHGRTESEELHLLFRTATAETDVRLPSPTISCMNCRREFTSVLFPMRCFFCKHQFCEHCLRPVQLTHTHPRTTTGGGGGEDADRTATGSRSRAQTADATSAPHVSLTSTDGAGGSDVDGQGEVVLACTQCAENFTRRMARYTRNGTGSERAHSTSASCDASTTSTNTATATASGTAAAAATATARKKALPSTITVSSTATNNTTAATATGDKEASMTRTESQGAPRNIPSVHSLNSLSSTMTGTSYSAAGPNTLATPSLRSLAAPPANPSPSSLQGASEVTHAAEDGTTQDGTSSRHAPPVSSPSSSSLASAAEAGVVRSRVLPTNSSPPPATDICLDDFQLLTVLGQGTFGKVLKVLHKPSGQIYAMKVLNKAAVHKRCMTSYTLEEVRLLTEVLPPHPYTVHCHFAFQTAYFVYMVIDYLPGGEFFDYIYPRLRLSTSDVVFYTAEIVLALGHLHRYDVAHRDLKPENIVMDADGHAHLTDFGLARSNFSHTRRCSFVGSAEYVPPETIHGEIQTTAVDWWSFGVLLYELLAGAPPFHADNNSDVYKNVVEMTQLPFQPPERFSQDAISLISQLLERNVRLRLQDTNLIQSHPFFASVDWKALQARALPAPHRPERLLENDTRYFKRTFTSEWATVPLPAPAGCMTRRSIHSLEKCFSAFPVIHHRDSMDNAVDAAHENTALRKTNSEEIAPVRPPFLYDPSTMVPLETTRTNTLAHLETQLAIDRVELYGTWEITKIEVRALDGRVTYPWGGAVSGMLVYSPSGTFSLQVAPAQSVRRPLTAAYAGRGVRGHVNGEAAAPKLADVVSDHLARQEDRVVVLEAMVNSFTSCFGTFTTVLEPVRLSTTPLPSTASMAKSDDVETAAAAGGGGGGESADASGRAPSPTEPSSPAASPDAVKRNFIIRHHTQANLVPDLSGKPMDLYYELEVHAGAASTMPRRMSEIAMETKTPLRQRGDVQNPFRDATEAREQEGMFLRLATRAQPVPGETFAAQTVLTWRRTSKFSH